MAMDMGADLQQGPIVKRNGPAHSQYARPWPSVKLVLRFNNGAVRSSLSLPFFALQGPHAISMASTTMVVASPSNESLRMNTLPIIDLRLLSQSELYYLSRFSSSSSSSPSQSNNDDDVLIPKIDRSVFNESAGSRKQTYSRLRLGPRKPQFSSSSTSIIRSQSPERLNVESAQIIALFKQLFVAESQCTVNDNYGDEDEEDLVLIDHIYDESVPDSSYAILQSIPVDIIDSSYAPIKRRRGRPRKDGNRFTQSNGNAGPNSKSGCEERVEEDEIVMVML